MNQPRNLVTEARRILKGDGIVPPQPSCMVLMPVNGDGDRAVLCQFMDGHLMGAVLLSRKGAQNFIAQLQEWAG